MSDGAVGRSEPVRPGRSPHPRNTLDDVIHSPVRLSIMATLAQAGEMDFADLRSVVEVSDSLLSKHIRQLEDRGYVEVAKGYVGKRPRTWLALSESGRTAFARYRATLREILEHPELPTTTTPDLPVTPR